MSTVVDNDKYIINGSTLSAIGNAVREKNMIPKKKKVSIDVFYKSYTIQTSYGSIKTIDASYFGLTSQTPVRARVQIVSSGSYSMYMQGTGDSGFSTIAAGQTYIKTLPIQFQGSASSYYSNITAKIFPLDGNGDYIILTAEDDDSEYLTQEKEVVVLNTDGLLVQNIASTILAANQYKFAAISPFTIGKNFQSATDISEYISDITDIVYLYVPSYPSGGYWGRLAPKESEKTTSGSYEAYPMKIYGGSTSSPVVADWETRLEKSTNKVNVHYENGRLVCSGGYDYQASYMPAFLIYK